MKYLFISLAVLGLPLMMLTLYQLTQRGERQYLGSFLIIKVFASRISKVISFRDYPLVILRFALALLLALLVINPSEKEIPNRKIIVHDRQEPAHLEVKPLFALRLIVDEAMNDIFDQDLLFIESFLEDFLAAREDVYVIYAPTEKEINNIIGDSVIFLSDKQDVASLNSAWSDIIELKPRSDSLTRIKNEEIPIMQFFPAQVLDKSRIRVLLELESGEPAVVEFLASGKRILLFLVGLSSDWGEFGISGRFIPLMRGFLSRSENSSEAPVFVNGEDQPKSSIYGQVNAILSTELIIIWIAIIIILESVYFLRPFMLKK